MVTDSGYCDGCFLYSHDKIPVSHLHHSSCFFAEEASTLFGRHLACGACVPMRLHASVLRLYVRSHDILHTMIN